MKQTEEWLTEPGGLARRLRALRNAAGLTGADLAERAGWGQPKVSKIENGRQMPTLEDLATWASICDEPGALDELRSLLEAVATRHEEFVHQRRHGQAAVQQSYDEAVRASSTVFDLELLAIPGLLQTTEYARARMVENVRLYGFDEAEVPAGLAARMRRQEVLYDTGKEFTFLLCEAALRVLLCPPAVMLGQLDRLSTVAGLDNIRLGIIPLGRELAVSPINSFLLLDSQVIIETYASEIVLNGEEFQQYQRYAEMIAGTAIFGDEAAAVIQRVAADLRAMQQPRGR